MAELTEPILDAQLRTLFDGAPEDMSVPTDVSSLYKLRLRTIIRERLAMLVALDGVATIAAVIAFVAGVAVVGVGVLALLLLFWIVLLFVQHGRAKNDFFDAYARARGLTITKNGGVPTKSVPLMRRGDKRKCPQVLTGTVMGVPATIANYTYTEVSTDSEGRRTESDYPYLILHVPLPAEVGARFAGVYLNPNGWTLGGLGDKLSHDRGVELESTDFNKRYNLRVVDGQDDVALYELFSPTFIEALTLGPKIHWQQVGTDLLFYRKKHETEAADIDAFVAQAAPIVQRYREEWR